MNGILWERDEEDVQEIDDGMKEVKSIGCEKLKW